MVAATLEGEHFTVTHYGEGSAVQYPSGMSLMDALKESHPPSLHRPFPDDFDVVLIPPKRIRRWIDEERQAGSGT